MRPFTQTEKTKIFIEQVGKMVQSGDVKNFTVISDQLNWNRTMLSNIMRGRQNVPNDKYRLFCELYPEFSMPVEKISHPAPVTIEMLLELLRKDSGVTAISENIAASNREMALAQRDMAASTLKLVENNSRLITIIENLNSNVAKDKQLVSPGVHTQNPGQHQPAGVVRLTRDKGLKSAGKNPAAADK